MQAFRSSTLALIETMDGDLAAARRHYEEARSLFVALKNDFGSRSVIGNLADLSWGLGDLDAARSGLVEFIALLRAAPDARRYSLGFALCNLAGVLVELGDLEAALAAAREGCRCCTRATEPGSSPTTSRCAPRWQAASTPRPGCSGTRMPRANAASPRASRTKHVRGSGCARSSPIDGKPPSSSACNPKARLSDDEACRLALED